MDFCNFLVVVDTNERPAGKNQHPPPPLIISTLSDRFQFSLLA